MTKPQGSSKKGTQDLAKDNGRNTNEGKPSAEVGSAKPANQDPVRNNGGGQQNNAPAHTNVGQPRRTIIATWEEVEVVKNLIGKCMNVYLNSDEVVEVLRLLSRIDPRLTLLVWRKLEQDNPDFFRAYHRRVALCALIETFNRLLRKQWELMDAQRLCLEACVISQAQSTASNLNFLPGPVSYSGNNSSYDNSPASMDISEDSGNDLDSPGSLPRSYSDPGRETKTPSNPPIPRKSNSF